MREEERRGEENACILTIVGVSSCTEAYIANRRSERDVEHITIVSNSLVDCRSMQRRSGRDAVGEAQ